ncbi:MAG: TMEM175 family protein, partial [Methanomicrobiales archaeon]
MTEEKEAVEDMHLTKGRLEALSDGIFAFAMTLLVIGLNLPDKSTLVQSNEFALHFILGISSDFLVVTYPTTEYGVTKILPMS